MRENTRKVPSKDFLIIVLLAIIFLDSVSSGRLGSFKTRTKRQEFYYDHDGFFNGDQPAAGGHGPPDHIQYDDHIDISHGQSHGRGGCEESRCGDNIRHCPHGCVFNSYLCDGGASYDECCC